MGYTHINLVGGVTPSGVFRATREKDHENAKNSASMTLTLGAL
jgi:hypothetical protein